MYVCVHAHAHAHVRVCPIPGSADAQGGLIWGKRVQNRPMVNLGPQKTAPRQRLTLGLV